MAALLDDGGVSEQGTNPCLERLVQAGILFSKGERDSKIRLKLKIRALFKCLRRYKIGLVDKNIMGQ